MTQLGSRWVRAIQLDPELRADWEAWIQDRINVVSAPFLREKDPVEKCWIQGHLQEITYILEFIDKTMEAHRAAEQNPADVAQR